MDARKNKGGRMESSISDRIALAKYFNELGFKKGVEVGVAGGEYSEKLCQNIPGLKLYCVDPWNPYKGNRRGGGNLQQHSNYKKAKNKLLPYGAVMVRMFSTEAARELKHEQFDFVFIDGNHDYDYVMEDIITWNRLVRPGGIIAGHDYYEFHNSGVIEAVDDYCRFHGILFNITPWAKFAYKDDNAPCFWWRKE